MRLLISLWVVFAIGSAFLETSTSTHPVAPDDGRAFEELRSAAGPLLRTAKTPEPGGLSPLFAYATQEMVDFLGTDLDVSKTPPPPGPMVTNEQPPHHHHEICPHCGQRH